MNSLNFKIFKWKRFLDCGIIQERYTNPTVFLNTFLLSSEAFETDLFKKR